MSMRPGVTYRPETSITFPAEAAGVFFSTAAILPPETATSIRSSLLFAGSMTWPPLRRSSYGGVCALAAGRRNRVHKAIRQKITFARRGIRGPFGIAERYRGEKGGAATRRATKSRSAEKFGIMKYSTIETNQ